MGPTKNQLGIQVHKERTMKAKTNVKAGEVEPKHGEIPTPVKVILPPPVIIRP
jgi:hypothetical protein